MNDIGRTYFSEADGLVRVQSVPAALYMWLIKIYQIALPNDLEGLRISLSAKFYATSAIAAVYRYFRGTFY